MQDAGLSSNSCDSKYIGDLQHITSCGDFRDEVSFSDDYLPDNLDIFENHSDNEKPIATKFVATLLQQSYDVTDCKVSSSAWTSYRNTELSPEKE